MNTTIPMSGPITRKNTGWRSYERLVRVFARWNTWQYGKEKDASYRVLNEVRLLSCKDPAMRKIYDQEAKKSWKLDSEKESGK